MSENSSRQALEPAGIAPPFGRYSHGVSARAGRIVTLSGQLGLAADGTVPEDVGEQAAICFANIDAILAEAGLDRSHVVHLRAFVTDRALMAGYMRARDVWLGDVEPLPASTLMIVAGFTRPEFTVEVEALAIG